LLLASSDRMDKELTIAQMQGKFKLSVIKNVGHIIHEDDAKETYNMILSFINTFKITSNVSEIKPIVGKLGTSTPNFKKYEEYEI
jgi:protein phosphatase methylesterase 1